MWVISFNTHNILKWLHLLSPFLLLRKLRDEVTCLKAQAGSSPALNHPALLTPQREELESESQPFPGAQAQPSILEALRLGLQENKYMASNIRNRY